MELKAYISTRNCQVKKGGVDQGIRILENKQKLQMGKNINLSISYP